MKCITRAGWLAAILAVSFAVEVNAQVDYVPVAVDDDHSAEPVNFGRIARFLVLINDDDLDDWPVTLEVTDAPEYGTAQLCHTPADNCLAFDAYWAPYILYTYTSASFFPAPDSFRYRITDADGDQSAEATVSIAVENVLTAVADFPITASGHTVSIDVLSNDSGMHDAPITVEIVGAVTGGTATVEGDNRISYRAANDFVGPGGFIYRVSDSGTQQATATVEVSVLPPPKTDNGGSVLDPWTVVTGACIAIARRRRRKRQIAGHGAGGGT